MISENEKQARELIAKRILIEAFNFENIRKLLVGEVHLGNLSLKEYQNITGDQSANAGN